MSKIEPRSLLVIGLLVVTLSVVFAVSHSANPSTTAASQGHPNWEVAALPDTVQFNDPLVPVAVFNVASGTKDTAPSERKEFQIKEVILENRSPKDVSSVTLRWTVTPLNARTTILKRGQHVTHVLRSLHKPLVAGHRQTLKLSLPKIFEILKTVPNGDSYSGFAIIIGVSEIVFEDGSTWEEKTDAPKEVARPTNSGETQLIKASYLPRVYNEPSTANPIPSPSPYCRRTICKKVLDDNGEPTGELTRQPEADCIR